MLITIKIKIIDVNMASFLLLHFRIKRGEAHGWIIETKNAKVKKKRTAAREDERIKQSCCEFKWHKYKLVIALELLLIIMNKFRGTAIYW